MTLSPIRLFPLAAVVSLSFYALPAQAYDKCQPPKTNFENVYCTSDDNLLVKGIMTLLEVSIMPNLPFLDTTIRFCEGMAPVMSKSYKWGFINTDGKEVIAPKYDGTNGHFGGVYGFSQGLAGMKKGDKWGYITKSGKVAIPFVYDEIRPFTEGVAGVLKNGKWGFINGANKTVIPFKYSDDNVERYSVNYMGATYFIFNDGIAEVATINQKQVCINEADKKVACR